MLMHLRQLKISALAALITLAAAMPARPDDTEIFVNQANARGVRPNVLLILDTSGSMSATLAGKPPYDPAQEYAGSCDRSTLYWSRSGTPPACTTVAKVAAIANKCHSAATSLNGLGGLWTGRIAQWHAVQLGWENLGVELPEAPLECEDDAGIHGPDPSSSRRWARNGDEGDRWTADPDRQIGWSSIDVHTLYSANWLNWYHAATQDTEVTRLQALQAATATLAHSITGVNLGLMRFSNNEANSGDDAVAEGGMVTHALANISTSRNAIVEQVHSYRAGGFTPLSEALYEAGQYLAGRAVDYGVDSHLDAETPFPSVAASRNPANPAQYRSPIEFQCQRNYVVLLTDGDPRGDRSAEEKIASLRGAGCDGSGEGRCLDDMAEYLANSDLSDLAGRQSAQTYAIGFGDDLSDWGFLEDAARAGGGKAFLADDIGGLTEALQQVLGEILQRSSTFTTPSIAVNSLNRTQTMNELYISLFRPEDSLHWPGNLKKYGLQNGRIVDSSGREAIDPATGFFRRGAQSYWSSTPDDDRVDAGGAVSRIPDPSQRRLFTYIASLGSRNLSDLGNRFDVANSRLTDELLGTGNGTPTREEVIQWARGVDVLDEDGDGDRAEPWRFMGDPLHAKPAVVSYGGSPSSPDPSDAVVFIPTNDGFLHAVNARTGQEQWAFIPAELLARLPSLYRDPVVSSRSQGLDGDVRVLRFDANRNGIIEPAGGDKVWLFFGMRRGGRHYYALDVTDRQHPLLLWTLGPRELPGIGETWSTPTIARVRVAGAAQNGESFVLIMGGGYDDAQENYHYTTDTSGHRIFMVDAASGRLLWYAGGPGGDGLPDLPLARMTHSITGRITALDTNGDQFADRLYAADLGGRVWRFDIWNGENRSALVTGGVLASLGAADAESLSMQDTRRFYYAPDVALIQRRGADPYYNLAIGSGYRGHPLHTETHDRFYSIRDKNPFGRLTQAQYNVLTPLTEANLIDITPTLANAAVPTQANGWKLELRLNGGWNGEKVLAEALTAGGAILFPTYQPLPPESASPCLPSGLNRVYALQVDTGKPAIDFNDDQQVSVADAWTALSQTGIAGEVNLVFESNARSNGGGDGGTGSGGPGEVELPTTDPLGRRALCAAGVEVLRKCIAPGGVVRTFWQRTAEN